jgi:hypothetical protein
LTSILKFAAVAAIITFAFGLRSALYPIIEAGGPFLAIAIIVSCMYIAEVVERRRSLVRERWRRTSRD